MKEEKNNYQLFLDRVKKLELRPGSVKPIHIFRELYDLIEPLWEKIRNKPSTFPPTEAEPAKFAYDGGNNCLSVNDSEGHIIYDSTYDCLELDDADQDIEYDSDYKCLLITV